MSLSRRDFLTHTAAVGALAACSASDKPARSTGSAPAPKPVPPAVLDILILGGTGFLGPAVVESAIARGHKLTLFNRGKSDPGLFPDIETLLGDRDGKLDPLRGRRWHGVVDTSGYVPRVVKMSAELLAPNIDTYLFVSSISAYRGEGKVNIDESAPLAELTDPTSEDVSQFYGALKAVCERTATEATGGKACTVRPGLIVGRRDKSDRFTYWPVRLAGGGELLAPGDGKDPIQIIDVRDLADFIVLALEKRSTTTYNVVGPKQELTWQPFLDEAKTTIGSSASLVWVDDAFLEKHEVSPWGDLPAWVPRRSEDRGMTTISHARALADGLTFRPTADTVKDTLAWWNSQPDDRKQLRAGLARDRELELLAAWKAR